jgi:hypothetical protein
VRGFRTDANALREGLLLLPAGVLTRLDPIPKSHILFGRHLAGVVADVAMHDRLAVDTDPWRQAVARGAEIRGPFGFLEHVIRYQVRAIERAELLAVGILAIALNTDFNRCCS